MTAIKFDLDAAKAARAEASADAEPMAFMWGGEEFALPRECPWLFGDLMTTDSRAALEALLGPDGAARFFALAPSVQDVGEFLDGIADAYGLRAPGESPASGSSSPNGSRRSRPISKGSTG